MANLITDFKREFNAKIFVEIQSNNMKMLILYKNICKGLKFKTLNFSFEYLR